MFLDAFIPQMSSQISKILDQVLKSSSARDRYFQVTLKSNGIVLKIHIYLRNQDKAVFFLKLS